MSTHLIGKIDLEQIECRLLNTVAGQFDVVDRFARKEDVYAALASTVFGYPVTKATHPMERQTGKVLELQAGYGSGEDTIRRTLRAAGCPINDNISYRDGYRGTHPFVTSLWKKGGLVLEVLESGHNLDWGAPGQGNIPLMAVKDRRIFHVQSELWLDFSSLEHVQLDNGDWVWRHMVRGIWRRTYGPKLIENVIQWLARLVISQAMGRIHQYLGVKMPLTVHDDVFLLIPRAGMHTHTLGRLGPEEILAKAAELVAQTLTWLPMCPISVDTKLLHALAE